MSIGVTLTKEDVARGYVVCGCGQHCFVFSVSVKLRAGWALEKCECDNAYMLPLKDMKYMADNGDCEQQAALCDTKGQIMSDKADRSALWRFKRELGEAECRLYLANCRVLAASRTGDLTAWAAALRCQDAMREKASYARALLELEETKGQIVSDNGDHV